MFTIFTYMAFKVNFTFSNWLGVNDATLKHHRLAYICLRLGSGPINFIEAFKPV